MGIDKIGFLNKIFGINKKKAVTDPSNIKKNDSVNISSEAKMMSEINKYKDIISKMPDGREEKIKAIKEKLKDESYMSKEVYEAVADKLSDFLEI